MARDRRGEGLGGAADGKRGDANDGVASLDVLAEFHENLEHAACEGSADRAVFFRWDNENRGDFNRGGEIDDGGGSGFEAEVFALGVAEGDGAGVGGGAHLRAVVMARASEER